MTDSTRDELHDRMIDQMLDEKLGGATPPDLVDRITAAMPRPATATRTMSWKRMVLAASLLAAISGIGVGIAYWPAGEPESTIVALHDSSRSMKDERKPHGDVKARETDGELETGSHIGLGDPITDDLAMADAAIIVSPADKAIDRQVARLNRADEFAEEAGGGAKEFRARADELKGFGNRADFADRSRDSTRLPALGLRASEFTGDRRNRYSESTGDLAIVDEKSLVRRKQLSTVDLLDGDKGGEGRGDGYYREPNLQGRDRFAAIHDNQFLAATAAPLSTFSIDVDTAAYSVLRSRLGAGVLPPPDAVRIEELVNYFSYDYAQPTDGSPFAVHVDVAACPWAVKHRLVRIGLKGKEIAKDKRPASNLVFLIDVSGSMNEPNKLPLVLRGLLRLVDELDERDRVAVVVYAGNSGCVLASTPCTGENKPRIRAAIGELRPGGSTNGAAGIELAYQIAQDHFVKGGANRVILCTDGDFNVGVSDDESLKKLVVDRAKSGVFLTALGFGMGNHNDRMLETIADNGNGAYGYIDSEREVEKLFVKQLSGTLVTIAKDVKIQVEFNPAQVGAYRLIGYENRVLAKEDFNDDKKDAGDIGAGHTVTALYEIVPAAELAAANEKANKDAANKDANGEPKKSDAAAGTPAVDELEFQQPRRELELTEKAKSGDMLVVKLRYKQPDGDTSTLLKTPLKDNGATFAAAGGDFKFAAAVAGFGMLLRNSPHRGDITLDAVAEIASANRGEDPDGQRREFVEMVNRAKTLATPRD